MPWTEPCSASAEDSDRFLPGFLKNSSHKNLSIWSLSRLFLPGAGANPSRSEPESAPGPSPSGAGAAQKSDGSATLTVGLMREISSEVTFY